MSDLTTFGKTELLKYLFSTDALATRPTTWHLALHVGDPGNDGTANEVSVASHDANYLRQAITTAFNGAGAFPIVDNSVSISYPAMAAGSVHSITHYSIWDNATIGAGNCLIKRALPGGTITGADGKVLTVDANDLLIDMEAVA